MLIRLSLLTIFTEWQGVDTVIISAGVSALKPLYEIAGLKRTGEVYDPPYATMESIQHTADVARKALDVNYIGPLTAAVTFVSVSQSL